LDKADFEFGGINSYRHANANKEEPVGFGLSANLPNELYQSAVNLNPAGVLDNWGVIDYSFGLDVNDVVSERFQLNYYRPGEEFRGYCFERDFNAYKQVHPPAPYDLHDLKPLPSWIQPKGYRAVPFDAERRANSSLKHNLWFTGLGVVNENPIADTTVYRLFPNVLREFGVKGSPYSDRQRPEMLGMNGAHLPSIIRYLQEHHQDRYAMLEELLESAIPNYGGLVAESNNIVTKLYFQDKYLNRLLGADEVSEGIIRLIALAGAIVLPYSVCVVIEEPENHLHPWALDSFIKLCREISEFKQIILTTHSPLLWDAVNPDEVWVVSNQRGETQLDKLTELDPTIAGKWDKGLQLASYLNGGAVRKAVP